MVALGVTEAAAAQLQNRFQASQMVQVRVIVEAAKAEDLPIEPLVDKALEGIAKDIPAERIVQALQQVRGRYTAAAETAEEITPSQARQRALTRTMAQAMAAGMPPENIEAIADRLQTRKRDMTREACDELAEATFTAARDMVRMGAQSETVAETLNVALDGDYSAEQMQRIRSQFMHQAQQTDAEMVANQFRERVRTGQDETDTGSGDGSGSGAGYGKDADNGKGNGGGGSGSGSGSGSGGGGNAGGDTGSGSGGAGNGGGGSGGSGGDSDSGNSGSGNNDNDSGSDSGNSSAGGGGGSSSGSGDGSSGSGNSDSGSGSGSGGSSGGSGGSGSSGSGSGGGKK
jgi:phosphoserine phosphatase